ncbi:DUF2268 domain-containing putative Zn-dependent protease [Soonwooa sp.]|uniref:DUF2268 domain-containing putative Zn-dependent protease n=1 Tax=Soonwooa sp. TaxID=1938592 RepID=UPI00260EEADA|nr:DUF2268 domain-containing putative Zn-dependent protease [Soonwooa sp.]
MRNKKLFFAILSLISTSYINAQTQDFDYQKIEKIVDSINVQNISVQNLFKYQILAHKENQFNPEMIVKNVYLPQQKLWDSCYAQIFGDENAKHFNNEEGMINWNKTLFNKNKSEFIDQANTITKFDLNKLLKTNLKKFSKLVPYQPSAKISLIFTPITGIGFGGCEADQFALELNNKSINIAYSLEKGLPHELNHLVYEKFRNNDVDKNSALAQSIDEGFACYFTYIFFDKKITEYEAVENMTKENWDWFLKNEKEIFTKMKVYFDDQSGNNPLLRNDKHKIFPDAPKSLNYWLGFRIISTYVKKHGKDSWKDIYNLTAKQVLEKSDYEKYLEKL